MGGLPEAEGRPGVWKRHSKKSVKRVESWPNKGSGVHGFVVGQVLRIWTYMSDDNEPHAVIGEDMSAASKERGEVDGDEDAVVEREDDAEGQDSRSM